MSAVCSGISWHFSFLNFLAHGRCLSIWRLRSLSSTGSAARPLARPLARFARWRIPGVLPRVVAEMVPGVVVVAVDLAVVVVGVGVVVVVLIVVVVTVVPMEGTAPVVLYRFARRRATASRKLMTHNFTYE